MWHSTEISVLNEKPIFLHTKQRFFTAVHVDSYQNKQYSKSRYLKNSNL